MSKTYSVEPDTKKNVVERETWYNDKLKLEMYIETLWRRGRWYVTVDEGEAIPTGNPNGLHIYEDFDDVELDYTDDGCSMDFSIEQDALEDAEEERLLEHLYEVWDEDGYMGLEEEGWEHIDTDLIIYGGLIVEEVE